MSDRVFLTVGVFSWIKPILLAVHSMSPDRPIVKFESCQQGLIFDIYELFSFRHVSKSWVFFFCVFFLSFCFVCLFLVIVVFFFGWGAGAEGGFCWRDTSISTFCSLLSLWGSVLLLTNDINSQQKPQLFPVDNSLLLHMYLFLFFGLWGALFGEWRFRPGDIRRRVQP